MPVVCGSLVGQRHEAVRQRAHAHDADTAHGEQHIERLANVGFGRGREGRHHVGARFIAENLECGLVGDLEIATLFEPDHVVGVEDLDGLPERREERLGVARVLRGVARIGGVHEEGRIGKPKVLHQIPERSQHAILAGRQHVRGKGVEHHRGIELALLGEAAQQADGALLHRRILLQVELVVVDGDGAHHDPVQRGAVDGADLLALEVADVLCRRLLRHQHAVDPVQPWRDADHVDAGRAHPRNVVPTKPAEFCRAGLERRDLGIHVGDGDDLKLEAIFLVELVLLHHIGRKRAGACGIREPPDLAAVALDGRLGGADARRDNGGYGRGGGETAECRQNVAPCNFVFAHIACPSDNFLDRPLALRCGPLNAPPDFPAASNLRISF